MKFNGILLAVLFLAAFSAVAFAGGSGTIGANVVVVATPTPTPGPSGGSGGGGGNFGGQDVPLFPPSVITPTPQPSTQLAPPSVNKEFFVFAPALVNVGTLLDVKMVDVTTGEPVPGVLVYVYLNGAFDNIILSSDANGVIEFTPLQTGTLTYKGTKTGWTQANNPTTLVVTKEQINLTPSPSAGPVTGLFTAVPQLSLALLLLSLLASYFLYSRGKAHDDKNARNQHFFLAIVAFFLPFLAYMGTTSFQLGVALAVLEDAIAYYAWRLKH